MDLATFQKRLFTEGEKLGFTDLELYYEKQESFSVQIFKGEIDGYESSTVNGVSVRGLYDGQMGYAYTEKLDGESVSFLLKSIQENAPLIEEEPEELFTGEGATYQETDFYSPKLDEVTAEEKIAFLKEVEKKIYAYDPRVFQTDYAAIQDQSIEKGLFNNKGLTLNDRNNFLYAIFSVVVKEGEEIKSDFYFKITKDFASLDAEKIAKEAVEKSLSHLGEEAYPNQTYPVILKNTAAAALVATFASSFSAEAVQKGQSRLKGKLDEKIASAQVSLLDNPFLPEGTHSGNFDSEGVPTSELNLVKNGELKSYLHNLKTAKKDGVSSTGHGYKSSYKETIGVSASNLYVVPAEKAYEALYGNLQEGIIITDLAGLHSGADAISGDFSLAANGFYVKNGKIIGPTTLMTVAGNFFEVLQDVEEVGADLEFSPMSGSGYIGSPSLKLKSLAVTFD
ncbi:TldD/PmbA family protein [Oceanobacillus alkalisoli]|uniref:TldD/PmbA family protein n=1 Tax=Oceanobacillus alkalisoli TaxID=2925113 RepID=UPI001EF0BF36|nr:TldD/PmbA family protein [Oceanobacillus alkalisoli]MCF3943644.1 TldD/PmbA family protein [Oceanobacillus alkalisoli]MCG5104959.1 TldD/PmbA family protein [Oceanobacillus alkalisoli]